VYNIEIGKLPELEKLSLRGVQWSWGAISSVLQCAREVKYLVMKIEFCGDHDTLEPFPEVDLVDFFNSHPKLIKFEIHGAMFAAMCQKNSLKNVRHITSYHFLSISDWYMVAGFATNAVRFG
jgi:hypothetical protein